MAMRLLNFVVLIVITSSLFGCASQRYQANIDNAQTKINSLSKYRLNHLSISPANHKNFDSVTAICGSTFAIYRQDILESIDTSSASKASPSLIKARKEMSELEDWLDECSNHFGMLIVAVMKSPDDSSGMTTSNWLLRQHGALMDRQIAMNSLNDHKNEMQRLNQAIGMALMVGSSTSSSQYQYINPYVRSDGTLVGGHLRSAPNAYCYDNINGC